MNDQIAVMFSVIVSIAALLLLTLQALKSERGNLASWLFGLVLCLSFGTTARLLGEMREFDLLAMYTILVLAGLANLMLWHPVSLQAASKTTPSKTDDTQASA